MYNKKKVIYHKYNVIGFISLIIKKEKKRGKSKKFWTIKYYYIYKTLKYNIKKNLKKKF